MFNTFSMEQKQSISLNPIKIMQKTNKNFQFANLSFVKLNPWNNQQSSRSPTFLDNQQFLAFNNKSGSKLAKYQQNENGNGKYYPIQNKKLIKFGEKVQKNIDFNFLKRNSKIRFMDQDQLKKMNKTISVHNIEGKGILQFHNAQIHAQNIAQKNRKMFDHNSHKSSYNNLNQSSNQNPNAKKRRNSLIQNPMFRKFCNSQHNQNKLNKRQSLTSYNPYKSTIQTRQLSPNIVQKHKIIQPQNDQFNHLIQKMNEQKLQQLRKKISSFSINRKQYDRQRVHNIHEIRKRLKSTSEASKRMEYQSSNSKHHMSTNINMKENIEYGSQQQTQHKNPSKSQKLIKQKNQIKDSIINKSKLNQIQKTINQFLIISQHQPTPSTQQHPENLKHISKRRKSLYIGYRKYFHVQNNNKQFYQIKDNKDYKDNISISSKEIQKIGIIKKNVPIQYYNQLEKQFKKINS